MATFKTQKQLATKYGMSSKAFGDVLRVHGLKDGADTSQKAIDEGYTGDLKSGAYGDFFTWNEEKIDVLVKSTLNLEPVSPEQKAQNRLHDRMASFWKHAASLARNDMPYDVFLDFPDNSKITLEDVMHYLPKTSYYRNKELCYKILGYIHYTMITYDTYSKADIKRLSVMCNELFGVSLNKIIADGPYK